MGLNEGLPYVFDLLWDIKSRRRLFNVLSQHIEEANSMLDSMRDTVELTDVETLVIDLAIEELNKTYKMYKGE